MLPAVLAVSTTLAHVTVSPAQLDCAYRSPAYWRVAVEESVARGEIPDPASRALPTLPPAPHGSSEGLVDPTPCLAREQIFPFEDSSQLLLSNFSDGQLIDLMTQAANAVLAAHGDRYDFVGFWTNFPAHHEIGAAFYLPISNDVTGIGDPSTVGTPIFDDHASLGLAGQRIQGYVMMWDVGHSYWQPGNVPGADFTRLALGQEFEHRFALFLPPLLDGRVMQGDNASCGRIFHWNWQADGQGSAMEISEWVGSGPANLVGSFVTYNTDIGGVFSYTDLYLMGYVSPAEMDAGNTELRFMDTSTCGATYAGTISSFSSADLVASAGPRVPDSTASQKDFRTAWVMFHLPGQAPTSAQLDKAVGVLEQHQADWNFGTLGRGTMNDTRFDDCNCNGVDDAADIAGGGSLDGNGNQLPDECESPVGTGFCFGDGSGAACPCPGAGAPGHGCPNSQNPAGGLLAAVGTTNPDAVGLDATGLRPSVLTVFFKGDATLGTRVPFGDGLRCVGGVLRRFGTQTSVNGTATFPGTLGGSLSAAGNNTPGSGQVAYYQAFYRDGNPSFCTIVGRTNATNGVQIVW